MIVVVAPGCKKNNGDLSVTVPEKKPDSTPKPVGFDTTNRKDPVDKYVGIYTTDVYDMYLYGKSREQLLDSSRDNYTSTVTVVKVDAIKFTVYIKTKSGESSYLLTHAGENEYKLGYNPEVRKITFYPEQDSLFYFYTQTTALPVKDYYKTDTVVIRGRKIK